MSKIWAYLIPALLLAFFVLIMVSGSFLKKPIDASDNVAARISAVQNALGREEWEEAAVQAKRLEAAWEKVIPRVQVGVERQDVNNLSISIARLRGAIAARDKAGALTELYELREHWNSLGT